MPKIRDGVKRWSILIPTMALPENLRVAVCERLLTRLEVGKAKRAGLILIAHPKSGNTWLKAMISRIYQVRHGLPANVLIKSDELSLRNAEVPRIAATNGLYSYEGVIGRLLAHDAPDHPIRHKPVLFLARNPADIAVSWYFQFTKRQSKHKQELINHSIPNPIDRHSVEMWDFVRHSDIGLPSLIDYLNTWERNVAALPNGVMLRYEELRADPGVFLRRVSDLIGADFTDEEIAEAVRFGSFDNLRKLESEGFFRQGGMGLRDAKDPNSFKVRRGKVGGFRDYFTPDQAAELEQLMAERLSPGLGYTTTPEPRAAGGATG